MDPEVPDREPKGLPPQPKPVDVASYEVQLIDTVRWTLTVSLCSLIPAFLSLILSALTLFMVFNYVTKEMDRSPEVREVQTR